MRISSSLMGILFLIASNADAGEWIYRQHEKKSSDSYSDTGISPASWIQMFVYADGVGVAGTSDSSADLFFSANRTLGVAGFRVETWTYVPGPGDPPEGEIEFEGELTLSCEAAVQKGPGFARSKGSIELEIRRDGTVVVIADVKLDLVQATDKDEIGEIGFQLGKVGQATFPISVQTGAGENTDEAKDPVPYHDFCAKVIQRTVKTHVLHHIKVSWPLWGFYTAGCSAETLGTVHWNFWDLIPACPY